MRTDSLKRPSVFYRRAYDNGIKTLWRVSLSWEIRREHSNDGWLSLSASHFTGEYRKDARRALDVGKNKAVNLFHQLEKLDLIRRRKQGQGKPARVFVRTFVETAPEKADAPAPDCAETPPPMATSARETMEGTPEREITTATPNMEEATFAETAPKPEPMAQTAPAKIPTPIHDVKRPATPVEEERGQSATRTETPEAVQRGVCTRWTRRI